MSFVLDSIQDCYEEFVINCQTKNLSKRTLLYYEQSYKMFANVVDVNASITTITGMRLNTLINLKVEDINFENNTIRLTTTKSRKMQYIPMPNKLATLLTKYIKRVKPTTYLFTNREGGQLSDNSVKIAVRKYNRARGVEKTSVHLFRHTFAKNYLLNGGDVFKLQRLLGHSTLDITKNYVNLYSTDLQQDVNDICML